MMPSDPLVAVMLMVFLCFIGMLIMFLFIIRNLSVLSAKIKEGTRLHIEAFSDVERQLLDISFAIRSLGSSATQNQDLVSEADAPPVMTDRELSSLLTSIGSSVTDEHRSFTGYEGSGSLSEQREEPHFFDTNEAAKNVTLSQGENLFEPFSPVQTKEK